MEVFYLCSESLKRYLSKLNINLDASVPYGDKTLSDIYDEIKTNPQFCRDEKSIKYSYFLSILKNQIIIYTNVDDKLAGVLIFMFNEKDGKKIINFDAICSPSEYSSKGVGKLLINTLIKIGSDNNVSHIYLECNGYALRNYYSKFGFETINIETSYDSDDDEMDEPRFIMRLDLSEKKIGGRNKKKSIKKGTKKYKKKKCCTGKRRKLSKI